MRKQRTSRLERWTRWVTRLSKLVRAVTVLVEDLTTLVNRGRALVISLALLAAALIGATSLF